MSAPEDVTHAIKPQSQEKQPGEQHLMEPRPQTIRPDYKGGRKLLGKVALITGGDSGIGRAIAVHYARESAAGIAILYKDEAKDAQETTMQVNAEGCPSCLAIAGDVGDPKVCEDAVASVVKEFGGLDILVLNAAEQHLRDIITDIPPAQLHRTFKTNMLSMFYLTKAAVPHMKPGSSIITCTSIVAYKGMKQNLDYASTKGGIVAFTRSLSQQLVDKGIRVNGVAPGPVWTPLITASFDTSGVAAFGKDCPMKRAGQIMHPNGGAPV